MKRIYLISTYDQQIAIVSNVKAAYRVCYDYVESNVSHLVVDMVKLNMLSYNKLLHDLKYDDSVDMDTVNNLKVERFILLSK